MNGEQIPSCYSPRYGAYLYSGVVLGGEIPLGKTKNGFLLQNRFKLEWNDTIQCDDWSMCNLRAILNTAGYGFDIYDNSDTRHPSSVITDRTHQRTKYIRGRIFLRSFDFGTTNDKHSISQTGASMPLERQQNDAILSRHQTWGTVKGETITLLQNRKKVPDGRTPWV